MHCAFRCIWLQITAELDATNTCQLPTLSVWFRFSGFKFINTENNPNRLYLIHIFIKYYFTICTITKLNVPLLTLKWYRYKKKLLLSFVVKFIFSKVNFCFIFLVLLVQYFLNFLWTAKILSLCWTKNYWGVLFICWMSKVLNRIINVPVGTLRYSLFFFN